MNQSKLENNLIDPERIEKSAFDSTEDIEFAMPPKLNKKQQSICEKLDVLIAMEEENFV